MTLALAYGTNGFADHRLADALAVLADTGYDGVALTLDHHHLDPFAPDLAARTAAVARLLDRHGLRVAVETGARYLMDPWRKHEPTLVSDTGRARRVDLLTRAVRVAADLGADVVSLWSGILPRGATAEDGWGRVCAGLEEVLPTAERAGVTLAVEPEPGMFVERIHDVVELRHRLGDPERLRLTIDVGHLRCNEHAPAADLIQGSAALLAHVQIDDMRRGTHEHLPFGEGEVDLPAAVGALAGVRYGGLVAVELPRHSHAAPRLAVESLAALRAALAASRAHVHSHPRTHAEHAPEER